jgi:hypothetical protein
LQYVPGAPSTPAAQKLVDKFNDKYAGKELKTKAELETKVADFKDLQAAMIPLMNESQKAQAEAQAKAKEAAAKAAAEQKAKEKVEAQRAAEKNKGLMKELGITEQEAFGFTALVSMMGGKQADVVNSFKNYEKKAKAYGYPVTGFQAALIGNYTGSGYVEINKALRSGSWTEAQHVYVKMVNKALRAMPTYTGTVKRGTSLPLEEQAKYVVGHVKEERSFTSSSPTKPWQGNTKFTIKAIGKHGAHVGKLSSHPSEDEVVFAARTFFKVTKVEGKPGGDMHVHMEEMEE